MSVFTKLPAGILLAVLAGTVLIAQQDKPGSQDHPLLSRLPDYFIHNYRECDFDAHEFRAGSIRETVEGKKTTISYRIRNDANSASDLQILRNYQNAIQKIGGETPYESRTRITLKLAKDGAETWVGVRTSNQGGMYTVYIVEKGPMEQKVAVGGAPAPDPRDARDSLDHPLFGRFPGYYIRAYRQSGFDAEQFRAGSIRETVEGKKTTISYNVKSDVHPASDLQILRNYEHAVKQAGGEAVYESAHVRTLKLTRAGAENWLGIRTSNQGSMYTLTIVEKEAMEQLVTAQDMLQKLNTEGRVTLYIHFDTDKADIKPESEPVVDEILSALTTDPKLRLSIEGHTDNVGTAAYNQDLSAKRAQSVVAALTGKGVAPDRLSAAGFGLEKPIADNSTDEGKAKNRRVELVKQ